MSYILLLLAFYTVQAVQKRLPISAFHWGGKRSDHPGFWWVKEETETVYVRRIGAGKQPLPNPPRKW